MEKGKMTYPASLVAIGGSAGSLQVILNLLDTINAGFSIPVLLVLHRDPQGESRLEELLSVRSHLVVKEVEDKDTIERGHLYLCPADYHVLIEDDGSFSLDYSEKEHFSRPSIDLAFRAAADVYKEKLVGILLSGANADGAAGLRYIRERKGTTVVQQPSDALVRYMPDQALQQSAADFVLTGAELTHFLQRLYYVSP
jgi:two-component system chemotaxis response regulator CheB